MRSYKTCLKCKNKHDTSIRDELADSKSEPMLVISHMTYPVVIIKVYSVKCRTFLDIVSGSLYVSESFIDLLKINPVRKEYQTIETLTNSTTKKLKIYNLKVEHLDDNFSFRTELTILTGRNLCFTEFSTNIHRNTRLAASDVFHMFPQSIKFL